MRLSVGDVDWKAVSEDGQLVLDQIALPISEGATLDEIARGLGITKRELSDRLDMLAAQLLQLAGLEAPGACHPDGSARAGGVQ